MKILVFEYVTGGGLNNQELPASLFAEARLMLTELLALLTPLSSVTVLVMLDKRVANAINLFNAEPIVLESEQHWLELLVKSAHECDAVWPIAPEFDGLLALVCNAVQSAGKRLLSASADAVSLTANKFLTYQRLCRFGIKTIPTQRLVDAQIDASCNEWIVKAIDGVGCMDSFVVKHEQWLLYTQELDGEKYIVQPHLQGRKISLSALFSNGLVWLICVNEQHFELVQGCYQLRQILVNALSSNAVYVELLQQIAQAFPELWGYIGIDLIENSEGCFVLEINPRLTTSFVGIERAIGINIAEQVLLMLDTEPCLHIKRNDVITVKL